MRPELRLVLGLAITAVLFRIPTPDRGLWRRHYVANLPMPTLAAWNAPAAVAPCPPPRGGVGAYLETECRQVPQALAALDELGLPWARQEIPWQGVEPAPGRFTWQPWDQVVDGLRAHHYQVLGMLCYWSQWARPFTDESIERFGNYCERVAARYRGRVEAWEVWNEPDEAAYWPSTAARYAALLRAAYRGVKRGNPQAVVLAGSLSGADVYFMEELFRQGAGDSMDALSLHPYTFGWLPEDTYPDQELRGMAALMEAHGKPGALWVTEIAFTGSFLRPEILERTLILLAQSQVVREWFWFALQVPDGSYSLYTPDWKPRPEALTLRDLAPRLASMEPLGRQLPADVTSPWGAGSPFAHGPLQAWAFRDGNATLQVAWVEDGATEGPASMGILSPRPVWTSRR